MRCAHHPDRPGLARCMACRNALCQECATPWEGIHYCAVCLRSVRRDSTTRPAAVAWILTSTTIVVLFLATIGAMVWVGVLASEMF